MGVIAGNADDHAIDGAAAFDFYPVTLTGHTAHPSASPRTPSMFGTSLSQSSASSTASGCHKLAGADS
jgi:hypothetical protein